MLEYFRQLLNSSVKSYVIFPKFLLPFTGILNGARNGGEFRVSSQKHNSKIWNNFLTKNHSLLIWLNITTFYNQCQIYNLLTVFRQENQNIPITCNLVCKYNFSLIIWLIFSWHNVLFKAACALTRKEWLISWINVLAAKGSNMRYCTSAPIFNRPRSIVTI